MVRAGLSEQYFQAEQLADRLEEAEANGEIPASQEATSFSMAQRFRPAFDEQRSPKLSAQRFWRKTAFGVLVVLASLVPSALILAMLWFGAVKTPASGVIGDRYRNDPPEVEQASMKSLEPKAPLSKPEIEKPSVAIGVPDRLHVPLDK